MYLADSIVHGFLFPVTLVHFHSSLSLSAVHKLHICNKQLVHSINTAIRLFHFKEELPAAKLCHGFFDLITGELRQFIMVAQLIDRRIILFDLIEHDGKNRNTGTCYESVIDSWQADFRRVRHRKTSLT